MSYLIISPNAPTPEEYARGARLIPSMLDERVLVWRVPDEPSATTGAIKEASDNAAPCRSVPKGSARARVSPLVIHSHTAGVAGSSPAPAIACISGRCFACATVTQGIASVALTWLEVSDRPPSFFAMTKYATEL